jgi:hypothetical protein
MAWDKSIMVIEQMVLYYRIMHFYDPPTPANTYIEHQIGSTSCWVSVTTYSCIKGDVTCHRTCISTCSKVNSVKGIVERRQPAERWTCVYIYRKGFYKRHQAFRHQAFTQGLPPSFYTVPLLRVFCTFMTPKKPFKTFDFDSNWCSLDMEKPLGIW